MFNPYYLIFKFGLLGTIFMGIGLLFAIEPIFDPGSRVNPAAYSFRDVVLSFYFLVPGAAAYVAVYYYIVAVRKKSRPNSPPEHTEHEMTAQPLNIEKEDGVPARTSRFSRLRRRRS